MGSSAEFAYIERLHEDINVACKRLEEYSHESLVITVCKEGHVVLGSEKGKQFLEDKKLFIPQFKFHCLTEVKKIKVEKEEKKQDNNVDKESERVQKILDTAMQILDIPQQHAINEDQQNTADKESDIRANQMRRGTLGPPEITESNMLADDTDEYDDTEIFNPELLVSLQKDYDKVMEVDKADRENKDRTNKSEPLIVKEELAEGDTAENASADKAIQRLRRKAVGNKHTVLKHGVTGFQKNITGKKKKKGKFPNCDICGQLLFSWEGVARHKLSFHSDARPHECTICGSKFKLKESLKKHEQIHGEPVHKCEVCNKAFITKVYLKRHMQTHVEGAWYQCEECGKKFSQKVYRDRHKRVHLNLRPYICKVCYREFAALGNLRKHMSTHSDDRPFECENCGRKFAIKAYLDKHKQHHIQEFDKPFECETCGKKFVNCHSYKRHLRLHDESRPDLMCSECGKICECKSKLLRHMNTHKKKEKKVFKCEVCGHESTTSSNLKYHMKQHTNEKPYICDRCGKPFTAKQHMENHRRKHTGEKPFVCDFEGCGKAFRTSDYLRKHQCYHSDDYKFMCDYCGRKFKERSSLRTHRKSHLVEFRWPCEYCEEKYKTLVRYKNHIVKVHLDKKDEVSARTNIKFFPCTICPKVFGGKEDFDQHMNVHLGLKPFECKYCGKGFSSKSNLLQHVKIHTGHKTLRCNLCSKTYSDPKMLKNHLKNRHGENLDIDNMEQNTRLVTHIKNTKGSVKEDTLKETKAAVEIIQGEVSATTIEESMRRFHTLTNELNPANTVVNPEFLGNNLMMPPVNYFQRY